MSDTGIASSEAFGVPTIVSETPADPEPGLASAESIEEEEAVSNVWDETEGEAADRDEVNQAAAEASQEAVAATEEAQAEAPAEEAPSSEAPPVEAEAQVPDGDAETLGSST